MASYEYITFRVAQEDDGTVQVTVVDGGSHRGGISRGRLSWTGGLDTAHALALNDLIVSSVTMLCGGIQQSLLE